MISLQKYILILAQRVYTSIKNQPLQLACFATANHWTVFGRIFFEALTFLCRQNTVASPSCGSPAFGGHDFRSTRKDNCVCSFNISQMYFLDCQKDKTPFFKIWVREMLSMLCYKNWGTVEPTLWKDSEPPGCLSLNGYHNAAVFVLLMYIIMAHSWTDGELRRTSPPIPIMYTVYVIISNWGFFCLVPVILGMDVGNIKFF